MFSRIGAVEEVLPELAGVRPAICHESYRFLRTHGRSWVFSGPCWDGQEGPAAQGHGAREGGRSTPGVVPTAKYANCRPLSQWLQCRRGTTRAWVTVLRWFVAISARTIEGSRDCRPRATATATRTSARSLPFHTGLSHWPFTLALSHWPFTDLLSLTSFHWPFTGLLLPFTGLSLPFLFADVERSAQPDHKSGLGTHDLGREHTVLPGEPVSAALG